jgi:hypothetical protein
VNLIGLAKPVPPPWEDGQGWRVLTPDGQQVSAGGQTIIRASFEFTYEFTQLFGVDGNRVPLLDGSRT